MRMRLAAISLALLAGPAAAESGRSGVWTYTVEPSSSGGGGLASAIATAASPASDPNDPTYVVARCFGGRTELLVGGAGAWGLPRRKIEVTVEADGSPPRSAPWDVSTNGRAAFLDEAVEDFLRSVPDDGKLRVAVTLATGAVHQTIFATTGFAAVRAKIAETCRWAP